jgi:hypothetical protein
MLGNASPNMKVFPWRRKFVVQVHEEGYSGRWIAGFPRNSAHNEAVERPGNRLCRIEWHALRGLLRPYWRWRDLFLA